jgi:hypothetical protein
MKHTYKKFILRAETVRLLSTRDLRDAWGGGDSASCPVVQDSGDKACLIPNIVIATPDRR